MSDQAENATTAVVKDGQLRPVTVVEPSLGTRCLVWAADALRGHARGGLLGMSTGWWTWWWRESLAVVMLVVCGVWALVRLQHVIRQTGLAGYPGDDR